METDFSHVLAYQHVALNRHNDNENPLGDNSELSPCLILSFLTEKSMLLALDHIPNFSCTFLSTLIVDNICVYS